MDGAAPTFQVYKTRVLLLNYKSKVEVVERIKLSHEPWQSSRLSLHHTTKIGAGK